MASSVYGAVRFTQDADITVEPFSTAADKLYLALQKDFYVSKNAISQAVQNRSSFNVIHLTTAFKIDIFIMANEEFRKQIFSRRKKLPLGEATEKPLSFVSPEDIVLLKLDWYKKTGCLSECQWSDILGVLNAGGTEIDIEYLKSWAEKLGIAELLEKAVSDSSEQ